MPNSIQSRRLTINENLAALPYAFRCGIECDSSGLRTAINSHGKGLAVIGSGASYSMAILMTRWLGSAHGMCAMAYTPYEYYLEDAPPPGAILISARGKNSDILAGLHVCIRHRIEPLVLITAIDGTPMHQLVAGYPSAFHVVTGCLRPGEKEGFFGVQTLVAAIGVIAAQGGGPNHAFASLGSYWADNVCTEATQFITEWNSTLRQVAQATHVVALGTNWAWPAVVDFESKWIEGGLGWLESCESKNYSHGRYMNAHPERTAFILFTTSDHLEFLEAFSAVCSERFTVLPVVARKPSFEGACELIIRGCHLFAALADMRNVDISNPVVPDYGRRLFTTTSLYPELEVANEIGPYVDACVSLKWKSYREHMGKTADFSRAVPRPIVLTSLAEFWITSFRALAVDVDGTLIDLNNRDGAVNDEVARQLNRLLDGQVGLAIVTGRGHATLKILRKAIDVAHWHRVHCYLRNGSVLVRLSEDEPEWVRCLSNAKAIEYMLKNLKTVSEPGAEVRVDRHGAQVTIDMGKMVEDMKIVARKVQDFLQENSFSAQVRESGRCVDVFSTEVGKKTACEHYLHTFVEPQMRGGRLLLVGDNGHFGGNDHEMLQLPYSISVGTIHWSAHTCFPILGHDMIQLKGPTATGVLLSSAIIKEGSFRLSYKAYQHPWSPHEELEKYR